MNAIKIIGYSILAALIVVLLMVSYILWSAVGYDMSGFWPFGIAFLIVAGLIWIAIKLITKKNEKKMLINVIKRKNY